MGKAVDFMVKLVPLFVCLDNCICNHYHLFLFCLCTLNVINCSPAMTDELVFIICVLVVLSSRSLGWTETQVRRRILVLGVSEIL